MDRAAWCPRPAPPGQAAGCSPCDEVSVAAEQPGLCSQPRRLVKGPVTPAQGSFPAGTRRDQAGALVPVQGPASRPIVLQPGLPCRAPLVSCSVLPCEHLLFSSASPVQGKPWQSRLIGTAQGTGASCSPNHVVQGGCFAPKTGWRRHRSSAGSRQQRGSRAVLGWSGSPPLKAMGTSPSPAMDAASPVSPN